MRRPSLRSTVSLIKDGLGFGIHFFADRLRAGGGSEDLAAGEGKVVRSGLAQRAVYRDDAGTLHELSARCTHLGCIVRWNAAERTWDCPCHGSRFGPLGDVVSGPASSPLERRERSA